MTDRRPRYCSGCGKRNARKRHRCLKCKSPFGFVWLAGLLPLNFMWTPVPRPDHRTVTMRGVPTRPSWERK